MNIILVMDRIGNALLNTFLGMGTVFAVLVIIIFFISLLGFIPKLISGKNSYKGEKNSSEAQNESETEEFNKSHKNEILLTKEENLVKDKELVAVIIAAITAYLGDEAPKDGLVVRSIKRANVDNWKRS